MQVILRRIALWILRDELIERQEKARRLSIEGYETGPRAGGKRGRIWWDGYTHALRAIRESRRAL